MKAGKDYVGLGVGALIIRNNKVLMLLRTDKCRNNRHMWTIPGGSVETFEKLEEAIRRETLEEVGLALDTIKFLAVSDRVFDDQHWVSILYLCESMGVPKNMEPDMHEKMEWLDIDHLPENVTLPSKDAIDAYRHRR